MIMQANLPAYAAGVVKFVNEGELLPKVIKEYGNSGEYAKRVWHCNPRMAELIRTHLEGRGKPDPVSDKLAKCRAALAARQS
jgi:hypothetical protein